MRILFIFIGSFFILIASTTYAENIENTDLLPSATEVKGNEKIIETEPAVKQEYIEFSLVAPADQETFQNERSIPLSFKISPGLQKGDGIQLYIDGAAVGQPIASSKTTVDNLERGMHTISAALLDNNKNVLKKTGIVTIYVHYASVGGGG